MKSSSNSGSRISDVLRLEEWVVKRTTLHWRECYTLYPTIIDLLK